MSKVTRTVQIYSCDNPKCRVEKIDDGADGVLGICGTVIEHTIRGGDGGEFFACSRKCVNAAIVHVISFGEDSEGM